MAVSRIVDFNAMPEAARERLIGCLRRTALPGPILADISSFRRAIVGWGVVGVVGAGLAGLTAWFRFGRTVQGVGAILGYGIGVALIVLAVLGVARRVKLRAKLPFPAGRYLFPMDFIDARDPLLRLIPMNTLVEFRGVHQHRSGGYNSTTLTFIFEGGATEAFVVHGKEQAEQVVHQLLAAHARVRRSVEDRDIGSIDTLDPFLEVRIEDGWSKIAPLRAGTGLLRRSARFGLAMAAGLGLALPLWYLRNIESDEAMFRAAVYRDTEIDFEVYLVTGKRHAEEVRASLLPRAALRQAQQRGSVTALRAFLTRYPNSCVEDDAHASIHALFDDTRSSYRHQAATADPKLLLFMERLIAYLEEHEDSRVEARFQSPSSATLSGVDAVLQSKAKSARIEKIVPVAPHFDDDHSIPREANIIKNLEIAFSAIFPADIMKLDAGQRLIAQPEEPSAVLPSARKSAPSAPPLAIQVPTLDVRYKVGWAGELYSEAKGDRHFVGIVVYFDVSMRIPGQVETYDFSLEVTPPDHFSIDEPRRGLRGAADDAPSEGRVYDVMAERAFEQLTSKLRAVFFRAGSPAFEGSIGDDPDDGPRPRGRSSPRRRLPEPSRRRGIQL
jgi:hypothetical protein